ncbi:MAG: hypothetical protein V4623_01845 [Pseudomonadota bacterium]
MLGLNTGSGARNLKDMLGTLDLVLHPLPLIQSAAGTTADLGTTCVNKLGVHEDSLCAGLIHCFVNFPGSVLLSRAYQPAGNLEAHPVDLGGTALVPPNGGMANTASLPTPLSV